MSLSHGSVINKRWGPFYLYASNTASLLD